MSDSHTLKALSLWMTACVGMLVVAACAIRLRDDESLTRSTASVAQESHTTMAAELERCRTITYEKKEMLPECRKIWAEKRRQFFGHTGGSSRICSPLNPESALAAPQGGDSHRPFGPSSGPGQGE
jgi:conjugative transfer region protein TrbK